MTKSQSQRALQHLTAAEVDVLALLATGMTATAIGHARRVSARTVRKQLDSIYAKLGYHDRLQAVIHAQLAGLIPPPSVSHLAEATSGRALAGPVGTPRPHANH